MSTNMSMYTRICIHVHVYTYMYTRIICMYTDYYTPVLAYVQIKKNKHMYCCVVLGLQSLVVDNRICR